MKTLPFILLFFTTALFADEPPVLVSCEPDSKRDAPDFYCKDNAAMANRGYCSGAKKMSLPMLVWEVPENWD